MTRLTWDGVGERLYETGVDQAVLYIPDGSGAYTNGVAWNGVTLITEKPTGAAANPQYADNLKYLNLYSAEQFGAQLDAFTYPVEFQQYDGLIVPTPGVAVAQQSRKTFGLSYRTKIGNDVDGDGHGYKLHLVYGATASPSDKAYSTINDNPAAAAFSWTIETVPVLVTGMKPTSLLTINSNKVDATVLLALLDLLYGNSGGNPQLPLPDTIIGMFAGTIVTVSVVNAPTYNASTHVPTIIATTGVTYRNAVTNAVLTAGAQTALTTGQHLSIVARANTGYVIDPSQDTDWRFDY